MLLRIKQIDQVELSGYVAGIAGSGWAGTTGDFVTRESIFNTGVSNARITGEGILQLYDVGETRWKTIWLHSGNFQVES